MPLLDFEPLRVETAATIRARIDADVNAGIDPQDAAFIDTTEGGLYWDLTQAPVLEIERLWDFAATVMPAAVFPAFSWGEYLDAHAQTVGLERKEETPATGQVFFSGTPGTLVGTGTQVAATQTDPDVDPPTFLTTESAVLGATPAPTAFTATPGAGSGILRPATYYYYATAILAAGETIASAEISAVIPAQFLSAPTGLAGTAFTTGGTLATGTYFYKVTALNANGETVASTEISRAVTGPTGRVDLTWSAVPGASSYRIYRGTATNAENVFYSSATNSFSDTNAASSAGAPPGANTAQNGHVALAWAAVTGATGYKIYRSTAPGNEVLIRTLGAVTTYDDLGTDALGTAMPPTNLVDIQAVDAGVEGNVAAGTITELLSAVSGVTAVSNPVATSGGADVEGDDALRDRILLEYSSPGGAGNIGDYQRWALAYEGVGYATVEPLWAGTGTVRVTVTDSQNNPVSAAIVAGLQAQLDPVAGQGHGLAPVGAIVTVATPTALTVTPSATLTLASGYSLDGTSGTIAVRSDVVAALGAYIDSLPPGDDVILAHLIGQFFEVDGVVDVANVQINGSPTNLVVSATQVATMGTPTLS